LDGWDRVAPPGNQAATEKTNINLYHSENPVYSPKVGRFVLAWRKAHSVDLKIGEDFKPVRGDV